MTLPKINVPEYSLEVPSTNEEIKFRPFLVKEEKLLLLSQESGDEKDLYIFQAVRYALLNICRYAVCFSIQRIVTYFQHGEPNSNDTVDTCPVALSLSSDPVWQVGVVG